MDRHRARACVVDGRRECSVCGDAVIGDGRTVRHFGERTPPVVPEPEDARAVAAARERAAAAARRLGGDEDLAEILVGELYAAGWLRRKRGERRPSLLLDEPEGPRDPDHAERAAGERVPA